MADPTSPRNPQQQTTRRRSSRRNFLRTAGGVAAGTTLFIAGCDGDAVPENIRPTGDLLVNGQDSAMAEVDEPLTFTVENLADEDDPISDIEAVLRFGDGDQVRLDDGESVDHAYDEEGTYTAVLRLRDQDDGFDDGDTATVEIVVGPPPPLAIDFSDDVGVLNYALALEQLEAAFYAIANDRIGSGDLSVSDPVADYFGDLAAHEAIHRDFLSAAIAANGGDPLRTIMPGELDFGDAFDSEDNGAGDMLSDPTFLGLAGKIVSVEARHAAAIRATIDPDSENFADLTDLTALGADPENALDVLQSPADVVAAIDPFVITEIQPTGL